MRYNDLTEEAKYFLSIIEAMVSSDFNVDITHHAKSIRDVLDNLEGHIYKCLNKNNRYDHNTLKHDAPYMSENALELRRMVTKYDFNRKTIREHAKPLKIVISEIANLKGDSLLSYICDNVKSVTIMKSEQRQIDQYFKTKMPDLHDVFSRFSHAGIKIIKRK